MTPAPRTNSALLRFMPLLIAALLVVGAAIVALPGSGYVLMDSGTKLRNNGVILRPLLLLVSYALVAYAAYRRTGDALASAVAMLFGAALGWAGWEWQTISLGWPLFSALVLLLTWPGERSALIALGVILPWALLHPSAAWGALLLLSTGLVGSRAESRRRLFLVLAGIVGCVLQLLRGVDLLAIFMPTARPWIWVEGQTQNSAADPAGLALFVLMLMLLGMRFLRSSRSYDTGLFTIMVFGYLAWHTRRNGVWLGLAATPTIAFALSGDWQTSLLPWRFARRLILGVALLISSGLLVLASLRGPSVISGLTLPAAALDALPKDGMIAYRPEYEPVLLQARPRSALVLAAPGDDSNYRTWELIATNCAPDDELRKLQAAAIVLQPERDGSVISTLEGAGWQVAWSGDPAVVLLQPGATQ